MQQPNNVIALSVEIACTTGTSSVVLSHRFSAKYTDGETGLVYYGFRYYQPGDGRWLSRDPVEEYGGLNLYLSFWNNSHSYFDSFGLLVGLGRSFEDLIDGYSTLVATDKNYSASEFQYYSFGRVNDVVNPDWICHWEVSGHLAITGDNPGTGRSIRVYPSTESYAPEDSSVSVVTSLGVHTRKVTVVRPNSATRVQFSNWYPWFAAMAINFHWLISDQFGAPVPSVSLSERVVGALPGFGSLTDQDGITLRDDAYSGYESGTFVRQTLIIGNWEADASHTVGRDRQSGWYLTGANTVFFH